MATALVISLVKVSLLTAPIILVLLLYPRLRSKGSSPTVRLVVWNCMGMGMLFPTALQRLFRLVLSLGTRKKLFITDYSAVAQAFEQMEQAVASEGIVGTQAIGVTSRLTLYAMLALGYLLVAAAILLYRLLQHAIYSKNLQRWSLKVTDEKTLTVLEYLKEKHHITKNISLVYSEGASAPLLLGLVTPTIVLPTENLSPEELQHILSHELMHYKRKDLWVQLLFVVVSAIYWINPLVYCMQRQAETDIELACDTRVVCSLSQQEKRRYCYTIFRFFNTKSSALTTGFSNKHYTQRRMASILHKGKRKKGLLLIVMVILLAVAMGACMYGTTPPARPEATPVASVPDRLPGEAAITTPDEEQPVKTTWIDPMETTEEFMAKQQDGQAEMSATYKTLQLSASDTGELSTVPMGWPVPQYYQLDSLFGWRYDGSDFHTGIDIIGDDIHGKTVVSAAKGTVAMVNTTVTPGAGYGMYVIVDHGNGVTTLYAHLSDISVVAGQALEMGQALGTVGSTGFASESHLHFEVRINGASIEPYDAFIPEDNKD